jgi:hypothetical protein
LGEGMFERQEVFGRVLRTLLVHRGCLKMILPRDRKRVFQKLVGHVRGTKQAVRSHSPYPLTGGPFKKKKKSCQSKWIDNVFY